MQLSGHAAIVTGGASGLGAATAEMLAHGGARVAIFDLDADRGKAKAREIGGHFERVNVTDDDDVARAVAVAETAHGVARFLVNCAGVATPGRTVNRESQHHPLEQFRRVVEINLIGTFNVVAKFAARLSIAPLVGEERGVIINTASVAAYDGQIGQAAYASSKAGIVGLTLPVARDLAQHAIRVMTIAPGIFLTPLLATLSEQIQESLGKQVPHPSRLGHPSEFAQLVASIIENPMLNGETIRLDGAIRMAPR